MNIWCTSTLTYMVNFPLPCEKKTKKTCYTKSFGNCCPLLLGFASHRAFGAPFLRFFRKTSWVSWHMSTSGFRYLKNHRKHMVLHYTKLENHIFPYKLGKNSEFSHMNRGVTRMNSIHSQTPCEVMLGTFLNPNPPWALIQWHGILRLHGQHGEPISFVMDVAWSIYIRWSFKRYHHRCVGEITMMLSFNLYICSILLNKVLKKNVCFKNTTDKILSKTITSYPGCGDIWFSHTNQTCYVPKLIFLVVDCPSHCRKGDMTIPARYHNPGMLSCSFSTKHSKPSNLKCHSYAFLFKYELHFSSLTSTSKQKHPAQPWSHRHWVSQYCHKVPLQLEGK